MVLIPVVFSFVSAPLRPKLSVVSFQLSALSFQVLADGLSLRLLAFSFCLLPPTFNWLSAFSFQLSALSFQVLADGSSLTAVSFLLLPPTSNL